MLSSPRVTSVTPLALIVVHALLFGGCGEPSASECLENETRICTGADGCPGVQVCAEGTWSSPCECGPSSATRDSSNAATEDVSIDDAVEDGAQYAGYWTGMADGRELTFHVNDAGEVDSMIATLTFDFSARACTGPFLLEEPMPIRNGAFRGWISFAAGGFPSTPIGGSFRSPASASGTVAGSSIPASTLICGSSLVITSNLSDMVVPASSWSATPGSAVCDFAGDGECDERAGTGLCLEGTDEADCP